MKDFLGNEYDVGDKVLYAAMSGRSVTMVLAEVVKIYEAPVYGMAGFKLSELKDSDKEIHVTLQPLKSSRWIQHYERTHYVDERNGKRINPYTDFKYVNSDYWSKLGGYYNPDGTYLGLEPDYENSSVRYEPGILQPYIKEVKDPPKPVTITITENIVKWTGPVNEQEITSH